MSRPSIGDILRNLDEKSLYLARTSADRTWFKVMRGYYEGMEVRVLKAMSPEEFDDDYIIIRSKVPSREIQLDSPFAVFDNNGNTAIMPLRRILHGV